jgi:hypothetical protein
MILNMVCALAALIAACVAAGSAFAQHSDAAREQRWAEQIVPALVVGEAEWLVSAPGGTRFLALFASARDAKAAVLLTHGPGWHPDHGITGELRMHLVDRGYTTLSLQMPVLPADAEAGPAYQALFPDAAQRIAAGMRFLQAKGYRRIAIVSHAMGSGMAYEYLRRHRGEAPVFAWAALSFYGSFDEMAGAPFPVYDLYGDDDYRGIRWPARERKRVLDTLPGSKQLAVKGGGWFLAGGEATLRREVPAFLDDALAR